MFLHRVDQPDNGREAQTFGTAWRIGPSHTEGKTGKGLPRFPGLFAWATRAGPERLSRTPLRFSVVSWMAGVLVAMLPLAADAIERPPEQRAPVGIEADRHPESLRIIPLPHPPGYRSLRVDLWTDSTHYRIHDDVRILFRVERDARVYIFNTDAAGITRQIFPNAYDRDNYVRGGRTYRLPDPHYRLVAVGPAGRENLRLVAYASRSIYDREYHEWRRPDDPFPLRPRGAAPLLKRLESGAAPRLELDPPETAPGSDAAAKRPHEAERPKAAERTDAPPRPGETREPSGLALRPVAPAPGQLGLVPAPPPAYGEATTWFHVLPARPRTWYYYEPFPDYDFFDPAWPPVLPPPRFRDDPGWRPHPQRDLDIPRGGRSGREQPDGRSRVFPHPSDEPRATPPVTPRPPRQRDRERDDGTVTPTPAPPGWGTGPSEPPPTRSIPRDPRQPPPTKHDTVVPRSREPWQPRLSEPDRPK